MKCTWQTPELNSVLDACAKRGIAVDLGYLSQRKAELRAEATLLRSEIMDICGEEFELSNQWQLGVVLFEKLGLRPAYRSKSGYKVGNDDLVEVEQPIIQHVLSYRAATTGLRCIEQYERAAKHGRVHPNLRATEIGRIYTSNPNVQSTPESIRSILVADPRYTFVQADWRTMHLRLLANLSLDSELIRLFDDDSDPFVTLASILYGHDVSEVTCAERSTTKAITYALLYGGRYPSLARRHHLAVEAIQEYKDACLRQFPGVKRWVRRVVKQAREDGSAFTINNRKLSPIGDSAGSIDKGRVINRILQGSEADLLAKAIVKVNSAFKDGGNIMSFPIHDEILTQSRAGWLENAIEIMTCCMTEVGRDLAMPMAVKIMVGPNWGDLQEQPRSEPRA